MFPYLCAALILLSTLTAQAATYYVSAGGTNHSCEQATNPGTRRNSINQGIACLESGDTLIVGDGTYDEIITDYAGMGGHAVRPPSGTSAANRTTIKAENVYGASLAPSAGRHSGNAVLFDMSEWVQVEGFIIEAQYGQITNVIVPGSNRLRFVNMWPRNGQQGYQGPGSEIEIIGGKITGNGYDANGVNNCYGAGAGQGIQWGFCHGIYAGHGADNWLIDGIEIAYNNGHAIQTYPSNTTIRNTYLHDNLWSGIVGIGGNLATYNNVVVRNCGGIALPQGTNVAIGNTVSSNLPQSSLCQNSYGRGIVTYSPATTTIKNNVITQIQDDGTSGYIFGNENDFNIYQTQGVDSALVSNNICDKNMAGCIPVAAGSCFYVNAGADDYHTCATSPARGAGQTMGSPYDVDKDGRPRPAGNVDSGAYQFAGEGPATNLAFAVQPSAVLQNAVIAPPVTVHVRDGSGALLSTATDAITIQFGANPGGATLGGVTTQAAVGGIATFSLSVSQPGVGYTLTATAAGMTSITSTAFTVTAVAAAPDPPLALRSLSQSVTTVGTIRLGWDYTQGTRRAKTFTVAEQAACTGAFVARPSMPMPLQAHGGVTLSGAEVGPLPGVHGTQYVYPDPSYVSGYSGQTYFAGKGMTTVRLPFRWERVQPTLGGPLDTTEMTRLTTTVEHLATLGQRIVLVPYNFARYTIGGVEHILGGGTVTNAHFANLWTQLAEYFEGDYGANFVNMVVEFDLMHSPHTMPTEQWASAAQAAINAIRATGALNRILVAGNGGSAPHLWTTSGVYGTANSTALGGLTDSASHLAYTVNLALDDLVAPPPVGEGECVSPTIGVERLAPFVTWLRAQTKQGLVGELTAIASPPCSVALQGTLTHLREQSDVVLGWLWWAGGPLLAPASPLNLEQSAGLDKPQMDLLEPFVAELSQTEQTYTVSGLAPGSTTCWQVTALDAAGVASAPSNTVSWTVPAALPAPTDLSVTIYTTGHFAH